MKWFLYDRQLCHENVKKHEQKSSDLNIFPLDRHFFFTFTYLTLSCTMLKNGQRYFKSIAVFTQQDFKSMFDHFSKSCMKGLTKFLFQ